MNIIKRGMLLFIAIRILPERRYGELTQLFQQLDKDRDGYLKVDDLVAKIGNESESTAETLDSLRSLFSSFADFRTNRLSFLDFVAAVIEITGDVDDPIIEQAFKMIDCEGKGVITRQQLFDTIKNSSPSLSKARHFISQMDRVIENAIEELSPEGTVRRRRRRNQQGEQDDM